MSRPPLAIHKHFRSLKDPRVVGRRKHLLADLVVITICAVICGCNDWQQIATFAKTRLDWLKKYLRLPHGVPSHDTFERVFDRIDPAAFQACFRDWMQVLHEAMGLSQIAIDGKTLRGSGAGGRQTLHLVSAWATARKILRKPDTNDGPINGWVWASRLAGDPAYWEEVSKVLRALPPDALACATVASEVTCWWRERATAEDAEASVDRLHVALQNLAEIQLLADASASAAAAAIDASDDASDDASMRQ